LQTGNSRRKILKVRIGNYSNFQCAASLPGKFVRSETQQQYSKTVGPITFNSR
jgi:hypothetical protein